MSSQERNPGVYTFADLFAGIGGFHQALTNQGAQCVYASEWDEQCQLTYEENYGMRPVGDITQVDETTIPDHDVLCAGFPCQPFSISGKKEGFNDTRGTLFFDVMRIVKHKKPKIVLLENVKHLVHHDKGNTLKVILEELTSAGYHVTWKVMNAKDFGLAQNRERIIIVAAANAPFSFESVPTQPPKTISDIADDSAEFEYLNEDEYTILPQHQWKKQPSGLIFCGYRNKPLRKKGTRPDTEHLSRAHKQPNRIYHIEGSHPTLPSQETSGRFWVYDGKRVRRLTIAEAYRLQGFPESFKKNARLSVCYNQIGNAVAVPMIESVYSEVKKQCLDPLPKLS